MKRREFLRIMVGGAGSLAWAARGAHARPKRPNIVFVLADDQRWDMMSCRGNPYLKTLHFDRMAAEGLLFENAFVCSGVCSPSRASLMTGKHAHQAGAPRILWTNHTFLRNETPFPARLHEAGYHTAHFGKWHLGEGAKPKPGYDHWAGFDFLGAYVDPDITINGRQKKFEGFTDDILSELAAAYIRGRARQDQPFFAFVGLKAPHLHFVYPPRHEHTFDQIDIPRPDSYDEDYEQSGRAPVMRDNAIRIETFRGGLPLFDNSWEKYVKSYYRSSQSLDDSLGTIMKALDEAGLAQDTILVYSSDQGYTLGEHGNTEKHYAYEEVMRVPMLVRYPRLIPPGVRRQEMVLNIDVAPTLLDLAGAPVPEDVAGMSWRPLLAAGAKPVGRWRDEFLFVFESESDRLPGQIAVRTRRHKLVTYQSFPERELYDLERDPKETRNVIDDPAYADVLKDLEGRLERLKRETGHASWSAMPVRSIYALGPVPEGHEGEVFEQVLRAPLDPEQAFQSEGKKYAWTRVSRAASGHFDLKDMVPGQEGDAAFLAFTIELLSDRDPFTRVSVSPRRPMLGCANGEVLWDSEIGWLNAFNPPLRKGRNAILFKTAARGLAKIRFAVHAPPGTIGLD